MRPPRLLLGQVMHRRLRPTPHHFVYPVFYLQLPLRALAQAQCALFAIDRPQLLSFYQADHGLRDGSPLLPWIEAILRQHGLPDDGEIILQTFPRVFGYVFNPVSFWFCHDQAGQRIAVLAEVNNTFGQTHHYLLHDQGRPLADGVELCADKAFHVSPFCTVEGRYRFCFQGELTRIDYDDAQGPLLLTAISGRPQPWRACALLGALLRMPWLTLGVMLRIHWQALRLWRKGAPFFGARPPAAASQETRT